MSTTDDPDATVLRGTAGLLRDPTTLVRPRRPDDDDSDATVIRNTRVQPVDGERTVQRASTLRPLPRQALALPRGLRLLEYRIERVLGQGGFGITYLATDVNLHAKVAIKEYLPEEIAFRAADRSVSPNASQHRDRYGQGLENFLTEARTLASFRHPNIVRVARFFEAHHTAYMVLEYERGRSFKTWWLKQKPQGLPPGQGERLLVERLQPLLDGLAVVHAAGYLHRDIKPDNIQVRAEDGRLVLLDFGSAGQTVALADQDAVVVTPGYAPLEQYGIGEQGAWTDLYALAATLYWAVAGRKPPDAESRAGGLALVPAVEVGKGRYGRAFLEAIDWALQPDAAQRPRSVDAWRERLLADHVASLGMLGSDESRYLDDAAPDQLPSWRQRLRRWRRQGLAPAAWPWSARLLPALLLAGLLPLALVGLVALNEVQQAQAHAEAVDARHRAQVLAARQADARRRARALAADPRLAAWLADPEALPSLHGLLTPDADVQTLLLVDMLGDPRAGGRSAAASAPLLDRPGLRQALAGQGGGAPATAAVARWVEPVRDDAGAVWGAVLLELRPAAADVVAAEATDPSPADGPDRVQTALLVGVALAVLLATVLAWRLVRGVVRPVRALTAAVQALRAGRFDQAYVQVKARGELRQLVRSFNVSVDVLRQRERERETRRRS